MKANELRIGNYVFDTYSGIMIVKRIAVGAYNIDTIQPIPLNEEWLVRFGFKKGNKSYTVSKLGIVKIRIVLMQKYHEVYYTRYGVEEVFIRTIKDIHSLQNLYFALIGEELVCN